MQYGRTYIRGRCGILEVDALDTVVVVFSQTGIHWVQLHLVIAVKRKLVRS